MKMTQHPTLEHMNDSDILMANCKNGDLVAQKISSSDHIYELQHSTAKSDSFVVNMERFSHPLERDKNANSRIAIQMQRSLSRKGSNRAMEKKVVVDDRGANTITSSPRANSHEVSMSEKPAVVSMGTTDHPLAPQVHHHIAITNGSSATAESKISSKRFMFRRSPHMWIIDPRRILFFFATLSCMGTVLLIYFTLSIAKPNADENALN